MSLSESAYARYLSGYSVKEISTELMIREDKVAYHLLAVGLMLQVVYENG